MLPSVKLSSETFYNQFYISFYWSCKKIQHEQSFISPETAISVISSADFQIHAWMGFLI